MLLNGVIRPALHQVLHKNVIPEVKKTQYSILYPYFIRTCSTITKKETNVDKDLDILLKAATVDDKHSASFTEIVPGKGPPPEPPINCCMSGCANCVWIQYAEELKQYYKDGTERALREIDMIENPSLKAFIKLELSLS